MTECDIRTRRVAGEEGVRIECVTHKREVEECLAAQTAEVKRLRAALRRLIPEGMTFEEYPAPSRIAFNEARRALSDSRSSVAEQWAGRFPAGANASLDLRDRSSREPSTAPASKAAEDHHLPRCAQFDCNVPYSQHFFADESWHPHDPDNP